MQEETYDEQRTRENRERAEARETVEEERERKDRERAAENRARQVRQGVVPAEEEAPPAEPTEKATPSKPKSTTKK